MATEMCVAQTAIDARERELHVTVVTSACASVDIAAERIALEYLEQVTGTMLAPTLAAALAAESSHKVRARSAALAQRLQVRRPASVSSTCRQREA